MQNYVGTHRQALLSLSRRSPYCGFTPLKMSVIDHVLWAFLIENEHPEDIVKPNDLLSMRLAFLAICEREMVKLLVNYQQELFKGTRFRKHIPETFLQLRAIGKTDLVSRAIWQHRNTIFDSIRMLPRKWSNNLQLQYIFKNGGDAIPASMKPEEMLCEYPWLLVDCLDWPRIYPTG